MQCSVHGENIVVFCMHIGVLVVSRYHTSLQQTLRRYSHSHSLTLSLTPSLTHSLTLSLPHSLSHSLTHSLTHSFTQTPRLAYSQLRQPLMHIARRFCCGRSCLHIARSFRWGRSLCTSHEGCTGSACTSHEGFVAAGSPCTSHERARFETNITKSRTNHDSK